MAFSGLQVTIPLGRMGVVSDLAPTDVPPGSLIYANNIVLFNGTVQKAPGTLLYNTIPLSSGIVALFDWWPDTVRQRLIAVTADGSVYRDTGGRAFGTAIKTGLGMLTPNCIFCSGGGETSSRPKKLFLFTYGSKQVQVLEGDGITLRDIQQPAADWAVGNYPKVGIVHRSRLWAFAGQQSYASDTGDHENFTSTFLTDPIYPGEGGDIKGAFVYKGRLFVFKDEGFVYFLDDTDFDADNWNWKKLASNFGLSGSNAVCEALNDMLAGNTSGTVTSYAAVQAFGDIAAGDIFKTMQCESYVRENTSRAGLTEQHALYYPEKKQAFFTYRTSYRTANDLIFCIDYNGQQPRLLPCVKGSPQCLALRKDVNKILRPMYGSADGFVHLMDYEDRLEGTVSYTGAFQTDHMDFRFVDMALANKQKNFTFLSVTYVPESSGNLLCDYYIDGKYIDTLSFPMVQYTETELNTFLLNTSRLGQNAQETFYRPLAGFGRTLSLYFYNAGANESFQVASITVGFKPAGEQAQKNT